MPDVSRVSRADLEDRYPGVKLSYQAFDLRDGSKVWLPFVPTHRIVFEAPARTRVDYIMLCGRDFPSTVREIAGTDFQLAVTPDDFETSPMGIHVVRAPSYLHDPADWRWWRFKLPHHELAGGVCNAQEVEYLPDHPELLDRLRRARAEVRAVGKGVYFIQGSEGGPIKIGCSNDVQGRLSGLQTANPDRLAIIAFIPDVGRDFEQTLHLQFARHRVRREWFEEAPVMEWLRKHGHLPR